MITPIHLIVSKALILSSVLLNACARDVEVSDSFMSPVLLDSPAKEYEVPSFPKLSSFELFSITDLLMEIALRPCPAVSRPIMASLKKFFATGLSQAPQDNSQLNVIFYRTYSSLVKCLSRTDDMSSKTKSLDTPFPSPRRESRTIIAGSKRSKRQSLDSSKPTQSENLSELLDNLNSTGLSLTFDNFFSLLFSITYETCKPELVTKATTDSVSLLDDFLFRVLDQVGDHAKALGSSVYKTAHLKYFHQSNFLQDMGKCVRTLPQDLHTTIHYQN